MPHEAQEARQPVEVPAVPENTPNRSQTVTGSQKHRDPRNLPYAFYEELCDAADVWAFNGEFPSWHDQQDG
jgi:hypothetical protein